MKNLLSASKRYIKTMTLTDMAQLKLCLVSAGLLLGLCVPSKRKKSVGFFIAPLFGGALVGVMSRFIPALFRSSEE